MASAVDIANDALTLLGAGRIIRFADDTTQAKVITQVYEHAVEAVLMAYPWNSAIKQVELAPLVSEPIYGYTYQYQLPTDPKLLRILSVKSDYKHSKKCTEWRRMGDKILSDHSSMFLTYIASIDSSEIDPMLRTVIASYIASSIAYTLLQSNTVQAQMYQLYQQRLAEARVANRLETVGHRTYTTQLNDVRGISSRIN